MVLLLDGETSGFVYVRRILKYGFHEFHEGILEIFIMMFGVERISIVSN